MVNQRHKYCFDSSLIPDGFALRCSDRLLKVVTVFLVLALLTVSGCGSGSSEGGNADKSIDESVAAGVTDDTAKAPSGTNTDPGEGGNETPTLTEFGSGSEQTVSAMMPATQSITLPDLVVTDYIVVSSRRTGRTRMEYVLKLKVSNSSSESYLDVVGTLVSVPSNIVIIDSIAIIGGVPPNSTVLSEGTFTIDMNLAQGTLFDDLVWQIVGDVKPPPPPPPPGTGPDSTGIFMSIDGNSIPGEATSDSHRDWIELTGIMDGLHRDNAATGSTRRRSSFVFDGVRVMKIIDRSSPTLREALAKGRIFTEVEIDVIRSCGGNAYTAYAITLSITRIEALNLQGEADDRPTEEIGFNYTRMENMYTPIDTDCSLLPPIFSTQDGEILNL